MDGGLSKMRNILYSGIQTLLGRLSSVRAGYSDFMERVKATTIDLNQAAASYDLFTGATQAVVVKGLVIRMSGGAVAGAVTSISIQTNDATPQVLIDTVTGAVANLTNEAQLAWTGICYLEPGQKIQLTIAGGAAGVARVCDVVATYSAVVAGGTL